MGCNSWEHLIVADMMRFLVLIFLLDITFCVPLAEQENERFFGILFPRETTTSAPTNIITTTQAPNETTTKRQTLVETIFDWLFGVPATTSPSVTATSTVATTTPSDTTPSTTTTTTNSASTTTSITN